MANANATKAFPEHCVKDPARPVFMVKIVLKSVVVKMVERVTTSLASVVACPVGRGHCKKSKLHIFYAIELNKSFIMNQVR
jgi:hypothetical protein